MAVRTGADPKERERYFMLAGLQPELQGRT